MIASILLAAIMSFTVETKSAVKAEGDVPAHAVAQYTCTYQKGDVRAGDEATLTLGGLGGLTVESVEVYLRSNQSGGAGTITLHANDEQVSSLSGTFKDWTGAYDHTAYHPVQLLTRSIEGVQDLTVNLLGSVNSLHIEKYVISYQPAAPGSVTLLLGDDVFDTLTEEASGEGVLLPKLDDRDGWHFAGWSEAPFETSATRPDLHFSGTQYIPVNEDTLWSVWSEREEWDASFVTELQSGDYLYANSQAGTALCGTPKNGRMDYTVLNAADENQIYTIDFIAPDSATIRHRATGTYIGYSGKNMAENANPWLVWHEGECTLFYTRYNNKTYVLWPYIAGTYIDRENDDAKVNYAGLLEATPTSTAPVGLMHPKESYDSYTCYPHFPQALNGVQTDEREITVPMGIYELHIKGGRKYLRLRN